MEEKELAVDESNGPFQLLPKALGLEEVECQERPVINVLVVDAPAVT